MITEQCINHKNLKELREMNIPENLKNLTPNQMWLLEHQITAFWHGFGFSNTRGLIVPKTMIEEYKFHNERTYKYVVIKKEFMDKRMEDFVGWLRKYKESWENGKEYDCHPQTFDDFLKCESPHESRKLILEMICLLQDFNSKRPESKELLTDEQNKIMQCLKYAEKNTKLIESGHAYRDMVISELKNAITILESIK